MSERLLPEHIDFHRFAEQAVQLAGIVPLKEMSRLRGSLHDDGGNVSVDLQFGIDEEGLCFVEGNLQTRLSLQCQRCMQPLIYEIISEFMLGIVGSLEEADALPERYEAVMTEQGMLAIRDMIEDEIILNLPAIPMHLPEDCQVKMPLAASYKGEGEHPFQVLQLLKPIKK